MCDLEISNMELKEEIKIVMKAIADRLNKN
jgi:hypothetical protein